MLLLHCYLTVIMAVYYCYIVVVRLLTNCYYSGTLQCISIFLHCYDVVSLWYCVIIVNALSVWC